MRPVARRRLSARQAIVLGVIGVLLGLGLLIGFSILASEGTIDVNLGDRVFNAGRVEAHADAIERDGPELFSDVAGGGRHIWLQHLGTEVNEGWYAIAVQSREGCAVEWDGSRFVDCDGERYPADGKGLTRYAVRVEGGRLFVDLNTTL